MIAAVLVGSSKVEAMVFRGRRRSTGRGRYPIDIVCMYSTSRVIRSLLIVGLENFALSSRGTSYFHMD